MPCPLHTAQLALVRRGVTDQSGCVHRTRFKRDELQIIFNLIDTDSSGEIEIEELIGFIKPPVKGSAAKIAEEEKEEAAAAAQPLSADKPPEGHTYSPFADGHVPGSLITLLASSFDEKEAAKYRKLLVNTLTISHDSCNFCLVLLCSCRLIGASRVFADVERLRRGCGHRDGQRGVPAPDRHPQGAKINGCERNGTAPAPWPAVPACRRTK